MTTVNYIKRSPALPAYTVRNMVAAITRQCRTLTRHEYIWGPNSRIVPEIHFTSFIRYLVTSGWKGDPKQSFIAEGIEASNPHA